MSNESVKEKYNRLRSLLADLLNNRDPKEYVKILDDVVLSYVVTDEFTCLSLESRKNLISMYLELKDFILGLLELKADDLEQVEDAA